MSIRLPPQEKKRLPAFDGLRALAAILVLVGHHTINPKWSLYFLVSFIQSYLSASFAVLFFFTLSSFLLSYILTSEAFKFETINYKHFFIRRIFRIWPLYFVVLGVGLWTTHQVLLPYLPERWEWIKEHIWLYTCFVSNYSQSFTEVGAYRDVSHSPQQILWSLAVEEQLYLIIPFMLTLLLNISKRYKCIILFSLIIIAFFYRIWAVIELLPQQTMMPKGAIYYATPAYIDVFIIGGFGGWMVSKRALLLKYVHGSIAFAAFIVAILVWHKMLIDAAYWAYVMAQPIAALGITIILIWFIEHPDHILTKILNTRMLVAFGTISYGVYLWHPVIVDLMRHFFYYMKINLHMELEQPLALFLFIIVTTIAAIISFFLIEKPFLRFSRRLVNAVPQQMDSHIIRSHF